MRWWALTLGGTLAGIVAATAGWVAFAPEPAAIIDVEGSIYRVEPTEEELAVLIDLRSRQLAESQIIVEAGAEIVELDAETLGYAIDREAALESAIQAVIAERSAARNSFGSWFNRRLTLRPLTVRVGLQHRFNESDARRALLELKKLVDRPAVDAELRIAEHEIVSAQWGQELSVAATLVRLAALDVEDGTWLEAAVEPIRPAVTEDDLAPVDVTRVLASYETSFAGKAGARAVNIRVAAKYLDGAIILPGEELSFNSRVGRRVHGRGFVDAPVIVNDELERDVGGGVCQVATTLHAAAVFGNLDIVRRRSHSRPSGYAPLGLDATVVDGKVDLRIRNPYQEPILVHTSFPSRYVIRVELLGRSPEVQVEHAYAVTSRESFSRRIWRREELAAGHVERKQEGSLGMDVVSVLKIRGPEGELERRTYKSKYYPVPEVYYVGPEVGLDRLPELPEDATGVVIDGEERPSAEHGDEDLGLPSPTDVPPLEQSDGAG